MKAKKTGIVYKIGNIKNGMCYIGATFNYKNRVLAHKRNLSANKHYNMALQADFSLFGIEAFEFSILQQGIKSKAELLYLEARKIQEVDCYNKMQPCYPHDLIFDKNGVKRFKKHKYVPVVDLNAISRAWNWGKRKPIVEDGENWCACLRPKLISPIDRGQAFCVLCATPWYH